MAHGRPWYQRNGGDFVMATMHFPDNDHRWAYSTIVDLIYDIEHPLRDDPRYIGGVTGLTARQWATVRAYLLAERLLILTDKGFITGPAPWLTRGRKRPPVPRRIREAVIQRDDYRCVWCGARGVALQLDHHPVPWSLGGITHPVNLVASCAPCNNRKGNRT